MTLYTLVQHSGVTTGHAEFANAVELRSITSQQVDMVKRAGGQVFEDYDAASKAEEAENYPPGVFGLIPRVRGGFSIGTKIGGSPLYIPAEDFAKEARP
jgi:hypothetical protein